VGIMVLTIIILSLLLLLSISLIVLLIWYTRNLADELLFVSNNIGEMMGLLKEYQEHIEALYSMEMFYGDETLRGLIDHTNFVIEEIKVFEDIYGLTFEKEEPVVDDETEPTQEA
jgi:hypothetical protein